MFVRDLKFVNGCLDENFIHDRVKDKRNIYTQIMILKKSLAIFREILNAHTPPENNIRIPVFYQCSGSYFNLTDKKTFSIKI